jgi:hypothetical protein
MTMSLIFLLDGRSRQLAKNMNNITEAALYFDPKANPVLIIATQEYWH